VIEVPEAPPIPGLSFREFAGESDYAGIAEIMNEICVADHLHYTVTTEMIRHMDGFVPWVDVGKDRTIAEVNGAIVAVGRVETSQNISGERIYFCSGNVRPGWRRRGIGRALLMHGERRLCQIAAGHPKDGPKFFQSYPVGSTQAGYIALLEKNGYRVIRYSFDMVLPSFDKIPDAPLPGGLQIRPVRDQNLREIWDAKEEAFQDLWGFIPMGEKAYASWCEDPFWRKDITSIAWSGSEVVGMVLGLANEDENRKHNRRRIYTESICVRRPWRKRGVARALIADCLRLARAAGFTEAGLGVDAENPSGALRLYESIGYRVANQSMYFRKPMN
jgi:ribosomal protein S18 acetylase RimI-like enzyme